MFVAVSASGQFMRVLTQYCQREVKILSRQRADWLNPLLFFVLIAVLFPLTLNPSPQTLCKIAASVIWVSSLMAILLLMVNAFDEDYSNGWLAQLWVSEQSLLAYVWIKIAMRWLFFIGPLLLMVPLVALSYHLSWRVINFLLLGLLLGSPSLVLLAALISSMALTTRQNGVLVAIILFPVYIPVLVLGAGSVTEYVQQLSAMTPLLLLTVILLVVGSVVPAVTAWLLRQNVAFQ